MTETFEFKEMYFCIDSAGLYADDMDEEEEDCINGEIEGERKAIHSLPALSDVVARITAEDFSLIQSTGLEGVYETFAYTMPKWLLESGACYIFGWLFYGKGYKVKCIDFFHYVVSKGDIEIVIAEDDKGGGCEWFLCGRVVAEEIVKMTAEVPVAENEEDEDAGCIGLMKSILEYEKNTDARKQNGEWIEEVLADR